MQTIDEKKTPGLIGTSTHIFFHPLMIDDGETLSHLTTQKYFQHPSLPDPKTHVTLTVFVFFLATVGLLVFNFE